MRGEEFVFISPEHNHQDQRQKKQKREDADKNQDVGREDLFICIVTSCQQYCRNLLLFALLQDLRGEVFGDWC